MAKTHTSNWKLPLQLCPLSVLCCIYMCFKITFSTQFVAFLNFSPLTVNFCFRSEFLSRNKHVIGIMFAKNNLSNCISLECIGFGSVTFNISGNFTKFSVWNPAFHSLCGFVCGLFRLVNFLFHHRVRFGQCVQLIAKESQSGKWMAIMLTHKNYQRCQQPPWLSVIKDCDHLVGCPWSKIATMSLVVRDQRLQPPPWWIKFFTKKT